MDFWYFTRMPHGFGPPKRPGENWIACAVAQVLGSLRRRTPSGRAADDCDARAVLEHLDVDLSELAHALSVVVPNLINGMCAI